MCVPRIFTRNTGMNMEERKTRLSRRSIFLFSFAFFRHCQINRIKRENKTIRFPICRIVAVIQAEITKKNILYQEKGLWVLTKS